MRPSSAQVKFNPSLHLAWGDLAVDNPQAPHIIKFHLKHSQTGQGVDVVLGKTGLGLCPVAAVLPGGATKRAPSSSPQQGHH